ncbi:thioesterase II family protein [Streptomyces sp. NPDC001549]|uniref:thioesterase II family protein n=1 Tax=Streptomyces sp. NPDC001549 TaxID=3364586 RepID=UPI0036C7FCF7
MNGTDLTTRQGAAVRYDDCYRVYRPRPTARLRLVCFPHAGGGASFYQRWVRHFPDWVELVIARYPDREDRLGEALPDTLELLADQFATALAPAVDRPTAVFGHSMGAAVAYEVTRRLERRGKNPTRLILSAHPAPHRQRPNTVHRMDDEGLIADVVGLNAASAARFEDPAIRQLVLPAIRADYRLIETYRPASPGLVRTPIAAVINLEDREVDADEARGWRDCTTGDFELRQMPGGHFHLVEQDLEFVRWLVTALRVDPPSWPSTP